MAAGWEFDSSKPIYQQIAQVIARRISSGTYALGERLPSVRDFAMEAGVNPNTMARALSDLEQRGLIVTERATGKYVTDDEVQLKKLKDEMMEEKIADCIEALRKMGLGPDEIVRAIQNYLERSAS